jgi:hypothetical protein
MRLKKSRKQSAETRLRRVREKLKAALACLDRIAAKPGIPEGMTDWENVFKNARHDARETARAIRCEGNPICKPCRAQLERYK